MPPKKVSTTSTAAGKKRKREPKSKAFKFFELPPELRNEIFAIASIDHPTADLSARTFSNLVSKPQFSLIQASKRLRHEGRPMYAASAKEIIATVKDLDFGPVIMYFNRCADRELKTLPHTESGIEDESNRKMTDSSHYFVDRPQRWINRFARPAKKRTNILVKYRCIGHPAE